MVEVHSVAPQIREATPFVRLAASPSANRMPTVGTPNRALINRYRHGRGGNAVGHYHERTGSGFRSRGDVEVGGNDGIAGGNSHRAMAVRFGVENVTAGLIGDPHQGVVRRGF